MVKSTKKNSGSTTERGNKKSKTTGSENENSASNAASTTSLDENLEATQEVGASSKARSSQKSKSKTAESEQDDEDEESENRGNGSARRYSLDYARPNYGDERYYGREPDRFDRDYRYESQGRGPYPYDRNFRESDDYEYRRPQNWRGGSRFDYSEEGRGWVGDPQRPRETGRYQQDSGRYQQQDFGRNSRFSNEEDEEFYDGRSARGANPQNYRNYEDYETSSRNFNRRGNGRPRRDW